MSSIQHKIIVIVGPTGVGKTATAFKLCDDLGGALINADSRQVYVDLSIGTAKPTPQEFGNRPHYLFDFLTPDKNWDVAQFRDAADKAVNDAVSRGFVPILVGGTGLYVRALLFGLFEGPASVPELRQELEEQVKAGKIAELYAELQKVDPPSASAIHPNDPIRIVRALEVFRSTGRSIIELQKEHAFQSPRYEYLKIGLNCNREILYERINARVDEMIKNHLEDEVLKVQKLWPNSPIIERSIGYKEWGRLQDGLTDRISVIEEIKKNSRRFAKRQLTWFRQESDVQWMIAEEYEPILQKAKDFLKGVTP